MIVSVVVGHRWSSLRLFFSLYLGVSGLEDTGSLRKLAGFPRALAWLPCEVDLLESDANEAFQLLSLQEGCGL